MMDKNKTKAQLINELEELHTRVASLEASRVEHHRDEREVEESEEIYRSLVDLSPDPVVILKAIVTNLSAKPLPKSSDTLKRI